MIYMCVCFMKSEDMTLCDFLSYRVAKTHRIPYLYRSFSTKVTYILVALLWKMICNLGDPISLRHPVAAVGLYLCIMGLYVFGDTHL